MSYYDRKLDSGTATFPVGRSSSAERAIRTLITEIGVEIDGPNPWDIRVNDPRFYRRVLADGSLGLGETYMQGWWDCDDLVELIARIARADLESRLMTSWRLVWEGLKARAFNLQSPRRAPIVGRDHYDRTIEAYRCMTDKWVTLSCGYWKDATNLDEAQEGKLDLICRKIGLRERDRVLDIGCGFGSFARFAATRYGCTVVGINISPQQASEARALCEGLPVEIVNCDYRDHDAYVTAGAFDKVVSVGMFEHVGYKNYRTYFETAHRALKPDGYFLLHTGGSSVSLVRNDAWFDRYIFANGLLPSIRQIGGAIEGLFVMEDWHNFGHDYYRTLKAWHENFERRWTGPRDEPFYRMWEYYLLACAGWFKARYVQLWHVVLSKGGVAGGYVSVR